MWAKDLPEAGRATAVNLETFQPLFYSKIWGLTWLYILGREDMKEAATYLGEMMGRLHERYELLCIEDTPAQDDKLPIKTPDYIKKEFPGHD